MYFLHGFAILKQNPNVRASGRKGASDSEISVWLCDQLAITNPHLRTQENVDGVAFSHNVVW
jgi:hypothetical protein